MEEGIGIKGTLLRAAVLLGALGVVYLFLRLPDIARKKESEIIVEREVTITIPEGMNVRQIASILERNGLFPAEEFIRAAEGEEGYLFPDTYRFYKNSSPNDIIEKMSENFYKKIDRDVISKIEERGWTLKDAIIMASILEKEVQTSEDKKIVAGILWKRIDRGMGLNVDAALTYVLGKGSADLTEADLKYDSPFNTYRYRGLPPAPISNPGLDAVLAAINPTPTKYFYYLTGRDGKTYYAETLEGHVVNKNKYLR